ncbi:hypothetical protein BDZ90DRAFT_231447 [Jaminaea rosea]|uniref:Uncharacterized protein n=1 Tax=Jaminaea rosea TaxID=1569628 RepID=A0A316UT64_9BASI|nr:hypothetical protein BDZ90DRAFT_231447 [Jaminaea rosea]PWN28462.1 hypothetical protein BDZ90DRAFT_231447 [Jaminaea rosea]
MTYTPTSPTMTNSHTNDNTSSPINKVVQKLRPRASFGVLRTRKSSEDVSKLLKRTGSNQSDDSTKPPRLTHKRRHSSFGALRQALRPSPDLDDMASLQAAIADQNDHASSSSPPPTATTMSDGRRPGKPQTIKVLQPSDFASRTPRAAPPAPGGNSEHHRSPSASEAAFLSPESSTESSSRETVDTNNTSLDSPGSRDRSSSLFSDRPLSAWDSKVSTRMLQDQLNATLAEQSRHFSVRPLDGWDARLMPLLAKNDGALAKEIRFSTRPDSGWDARLFVDDGKNRRGRSDTTFSDRRMSAWDGMLKTDKGDSVPVTVGLHDGGDDEGKRGTVFSLRPPGDWDASLAPDDGEASAAPAGKAGADLKDRGLLFCKSFDKIPLARRIDVRGRVEPQGHQQRTSTATSSTLLPSAASSF